MKSPPFPIAPGVEYRINGQLQVVRSVSPTGEVVLQCPVRRTNLYFSLPELVAMRIAGSLELVHKSSVTFQVNGTSRRGLLEPPVQERVRRRMAYGKAAAQLFPVGPKSARLHRLIDEIALRIGDKQPPSAHTVYRWLRRYVASDYDTAVFMLDADISRRRSPRKLTDIIRSQLRQNIQILLGAYKGATLHGITNLALAMTAKDLGYIQFTTKEGVTELADDYIPIEGGRIAKLHQSVQREPLDCDADKLMQQ